RLARQGLTLSAAALAAALSAGAAEAGLSAPLLVSTARAATVAAGRAVGVGGPGGAPTAGLAAAGGEAEGVTKVTVAAVVLVLAVGVGGAAALCGLRAPAGARNDVAPAQAKAGENAPPAARVVARVNGEAIHAEDVSAAVYLALPKVDDLSVA